MNLALRYTVFAVIATGLNLLGQFIGLRILPDALAVVGAMLIGTAAGLISKYWLDQRYIFHNRSREATAHGRLFFLYTSTGVATTVLFWAVEWAFHLSFGTEAMRYVGAVIGLAMGYSLKYLLDARYVFTDVKT